MMANGGQWQLIVVALIVVGVIGIAIWRVARRKKRGGGGCGCGCGCGR